MEITLNEVFDPRAIILKLEGKTKDAVFGELIKAIAKIHPECDETSLRTVLWEREKKMSTGIGAGIAIPHAFYGGIDRMTGAIGVSQTGIEYNALDQQAVNLVFMLVIGGKAHENHLNVLNHIITLVQSDASAMIKEAQDEKTVADILSRS